MCSTHTTRSMLKVCLRCSSSRSGGLNQFLRKCCIASSNSPSISISSGSGHRQQQVRFSSKTSSSNSAAVVQAVESRLTKQQQPPSGSESGIVEIDKTYLPVTHRATTTPTFVSPFSTKDIREVDDETRARIHNVSSEVASAQSASLVDPRHIWRRKPILEMEEEEYVDTYILKARPALLDRRGEGTDYVFRQFMRDKDNHVDNMIFAQQDIDLRPKSVKATLARMKLKGESIQQQLNPTRNKILGSDLSAAHFIVFRGGKVKFLGQSGWVTKYRTDLDPGLEEEDLPVISEKVCTLPTRYNPNYRVDAIDASGLELHYEGLDNFENLQHVKWLSLKNSPYIDDWCLERIARMFRESLEFIDLSGCPRISDRGIGVLHRCRNLKGIRVENLPCVENLEIVSAMLEDLNPNLIVIGVNYEKKQEELKLQAEKLERMALYDQTAEQLPLLPDCYDEYEGIPDLEPLPKLAPTPEKDKPKQIQSGLDANMTLPKPTA